MAANTTRAKSSSKAAPSSKKSSSSSADRGGPKLSIRYSSVMKPNRVYPLVVEVPKTKKGGSDESSPGVVVVRPIIPGALIVPAEQRLDMEAGNLIQFHVTPLAKGRLPRAHLDVFAANQPPESIYLGMKSRTQCLAWSLLVLAIAVPLFIISLTKGSLEKPLINAQSKQPERDAFVKPLSQNLPPVPLVTRKIEDADGLLKDFYLADTIGNPLFLVYGVLRDDVKKYPWLPNTIGLGIAVLAFMAWLFDRPRRKMVQRNLRLKPSSADEPGEPATLEPIGS